MRVDITDNTGQVKEAKDEAVKKALELIGLKAEGYAKALAPTDTGLLKNSITYAVGGNAPAINSYKADRPDSHGKIRKGVYSGTVGSANDESVYLGTNVSYAIYQEKGTQHAAAQPFIKPAASNHTSEYKAIVEACLKGA